LNFQTLKTFPVLQRAYQISQELGTSIYLVGGAVRDILMGFFDGKDFDFVLGDKWQEAALLFAQKARGTVIPWDFNQTRIVVRENGKTVTVDFAGFRGEDITSDLRARDFTINSIALCVESLFTEENPELYDPLRGSIHLQQKVVQADGESAFDQDPLRILRAIRFSQAFNFYIEDATKVSMQKKARRLTEVAQERVKQELFAIFHLPNADRAIRELIELGIMQYLIPELGQFPAIQQGPPHQYDLMQHSLKTVECLQFMIEHPERTGKKYAAAILEHLHEYIEDGVITRRALLICAGLLHDSGKLSTQTIEGERIRFLRHEQEGLHINQHIARRLLLGKRAQRIIAIITGNHMRIHQLAALQVISERAVRRFLYDTQEAPLEVLLLALADAQATSSGELYWDVKDRVEQLVDKIMETVFSSFADRLYMPLITGHDIMEIMNFAPGEAVGTILREIHDGERTGMFNSREEVIEWLKKKKQSALS
jgi:tRNA nucleotidyltransferase/poly(A) polymerase